MISCKFYKVLHILWNCCFNIYIKTVPYTIVICFGSLIHKWSGSTNKIRNDKQATLFILLFMLIYDSHLLQIPKVCISL
ncbi:unnamed protein product [Allacma fusca]|uniref:Uncharacterized protein n=1 Tax=Allacma fusca TaxID=39272 RepID=A0A8J2LMM9_9HEXA|nr:unnamed protein product [Allacma fusca]